MKRPETTERSEFQIAAPARLQALRLTAQERARLTDILRSPETDAETRRTRAGHFVSRLGPMKRVLWTRSEGQPTVLSIADQSYAPQP